MATTNETYAFTSKSLSAGVTGIAGQGQTFLVQFNNAFSVTDAYQFDIVTAAQVFSVGTGDLFANSLAGNGFNIWQGLWYDFPMNTFAFLYGRSFAIPLIVMDEKLYTADGKGFTFSALDDCTLWNSQSDTGAGSIDIQKVENTQESPVGLAVYQGFIATLMRQSAITYQVNADPALYARQQTLVNTGTFAPLSPQGIGELDVIYLSDTGFRSLRVRDSSQNAFVTDVGSAVDSLVVADFQALTLNNYPLSKAIAACGIVEPTSNRYWCYLNGKIYVLSYFPSSKIVAWSTYTCTYNDPVFGNGQTFEPQKFLIYKGQVYCLAKSQSGALIVLQYGGAANNTYDQTVAQGTTPWLDGRTPGTLKTFEAIDAGLSGAWMFSFGVDYVDESVDADPSVYTSPTYDFKRIGVPGTGTHCRIGFQSSGSGPSVLGQLLVFYQPGETKP